jgi:3-methylfumaryl-CoA hydratase
MSATTMNAALDADHLKTWIGREISAEDTITHDLIRKFRAMLDLPGPDGSAANIAPRLIHFCLAQPAVPESELGPDGHPDRGGFLPPVPLPRRMWAGGDITFNGDLEIGDTIRRTSRITDVVLKEGRTGQLCFVTVRHHIEARGEILVEERQDIVYRGDSGGVAPQAAPAPSGQHSQRMALSTPLLFRYSALTFNGHRIHYDRRYTMETEGYPGLIVHGPLQATLLMNFAAKLKGRAPSRFTFRSSATIFDDDQASLHASADGDRFKLWTARDGGPVAMSAEASFA